MEAQEGFIRGYNESKVGKVFDVLVEDIVKVIPT